MNAVCLSGYLTRAVVNGENHLCFTMVAKHGYNTKEGKDLKEFIPCVLFKPSKKVRDILSQENLFVELRGRISSSKYEKDGETKYSTKVIVDPKSINFIK